MTKYYYAVRINSGRAAFLARQNPSAPALFWFHEDAVAHRRKCGVENTHIIKVAVRWSRKGRTYDTPGNMFKSHQELKRPVN